MSIQDRQTSHNTKLNAHLSQGARHLCPSSSHNNNKNNINSNYSNNYNNKTTTLELQRQKQQMLIMDYVGSIYFTI